MPAGTVPGSEEPDLSTGPGRVLVVDDEEMIRSLISRHLAGRGYVVEAVNDGRHALSLASTGSFDIVLADVKMPGLDGLALTREVQRSAPTVPVVLVTGATSFETAVRAMRHGACDIVVKPFQFDLLDQAVERALARRRSLRDAEEYRRLLERRVEEHTATAALADVSTRELADERENMRRLTEAFDVVLTAAATANETRLGEPDGRTVRIRGWSEALAARAGLDPDAVREVGLAALLRDLGRIAIPDEAAAADREYPLRGAEMLADAPSLGPVAQTVRTCRERWDGSGFPLGLRGHDIPVGGRILAVAIAFENAMARSGDAGPDDAAETLRVEAGFALDPELVNVFLGIPASELGLSISSI